MWPLRRPVDGLPPPASSCGHRPQPRNDILVPYSSPGGRCGGGPVSVTSVTLTGSPGDAIARTPTYCSGPRSQIKHSYSLDTSSACDNLYRRSDPPPFSSPLLCGTQHEHSCVPCRDSSRHLLAHGKRGVGMSADAARTSVRVPQGRATMAMNAKDLPLTFEGACATSKWNCYYLTDPKQRSP